MRPAALLLVLALAACGREAKPPKAPPAPSLSECGVASYYHPTLAGEPTASGAPYDPSAMTAAHRSLPFGATAMVIRMDATTGEARLMTRVVINDRGPFVRGRIIDLSRAAGRDIAIVGDDGVARVCIVVAP